MRLDMLILKEILLFLFVTFGNNNEKNTVNKTIELQQATPTIRMPKCVKYARLHQ